MRSISWAALAAGLTLALSGCGGGSDAGCSVYDSSCGGSGIENPPVTEGGNVATSAAGTVVLSLSNSTISASSPGTVTALVKRNDGTPVVGAVVTFAVKNSSATVSPERVITDASGSASTTLLPVAGALGADYVTASVDMTTEVKLSTQTAFTVNAVSVALTGVGAAPTTVDAYGAAVLTVGVSGASSAAPVTVSFSSTCATAGRATISPASVTVTGTTATATYQDRGCAAGDRVNAVITGTAQQGSVELAVRAPSAQSLEFVSASPDKICLAGSGCSASSVVSFRLRDQFGNPIQQRNVAFELDNAARDVATLSTLEAPTDADGIARVSVTARNTPTPVRVRGTVTLDGGGTLSTVSNALAINAGLPTQQSVSFSAAVYNVDGWEKDGTESEVRLQLSDRFGNPVPDGTSISLVTEGASVIPARCVTADGVCKVKFVSSNFRPTDGRVAVIAYAQGEESFADVDGNNVYSAGEAFGDLGPVFVDKNENGLLDAALGEYLTGSVADGVWSGNTYVRLGRTFILASSGIAPRLFAATGRTCTSSGLAPLTFQPRTAACRLSASFCLRDGNTGADGMGGNPVPAGATLALSTSAKGAKVSVDASPVTSVALAPTAHVVTVELEDCSKALEAPGALDLTVKMPAGQTYTYQIGNIN